MDRRSTLGGTVGQKRGTGVMTSEAAALRELLAALRGTQEPDQYCPVAAVIEGWAKEYKGEMWYRTESSAVRLLAALRAADIAVSSQQALL